MGRAKGSKNKATTPTNTTKGGQRKLPRRTHNVRSRPSLGASSSSSRQSTFTQMEHWNTATPVKATRAEVIAISSDHQPDSDFEEPQPKKKRRVTRDPSDLPKLKSSTSRSKSKLPDKAEADQHTVTQLWRMPNGSSILSDEIEDEDENDGRLDFNIYADEGRDRYTSMVAEQQNERRRRLPWLRQDDPAVNGDANPWTPTQGSASKHMEVPRRALPWVHEDETATPDNMSQDSPAQTRRYDLRSPAKVVESPVRLSSYHIASRDFHTPKKSRLREIPSSQTPASAKLSVRRSQRLQGRSPDQRSPLKEKQLRSSPLKKVTVRRSPLKERSANVPSARWKAGSPKSQNPTMKMLERVRMRKMGKLPADESQIASSPVRAEENEPLAEEYASAEASLKLNEDFELHESEHCEIADNAAQAEPEMPPPRTLTRTTTVQDSQLEDMPPPTQLLPSCKLKRTTTVQDSQSDDLSLAPAPRTLKRTATVQDSQSEDLDKSSDIYRSTSRSSSIQQRLEDDDNDDGPYEGTATYDQGPYTYDPVSAALDRDAARFGWTQTQAPVTRVANSVANSEDEEDDDLDQGIVPPSEDEEEVMVLPQPTAGPSQELGEDSDPLALAPEEPLSEAASKPGNAEPEITAEPTGVLSEQEAPSESPPSSPPTLRPSQVSTVVPTQMSPRQRTQRVKLEEYSPPTSPPAPVSHSPNARTQKTARPHLHPRTQELQCSSSPLPFPPWSSPGRRRWAALESEPFGQSPGGVNNAREALENLSDFSLPPPPPLSSSAGPRSD